MSHGITRFKRLGDFLRSRRERLQPEAVGIKETNSQRRTPGLRREEVAVLAGLSSTYYAWLEQGREVTASREVMESLSLALRLSPDEKKHLFELWNPGLPDTITSINEGSPELNPQWRDIIGQLSYPSFITNERSEVLAWNDAAGEVLSDFGNLPASERIMLRLLFLDLELRRRMLNWEEFALYSVGVFRTYYDMNLHDPWYKEMVDQLCEDSADFAGIWKQHHIQGKRVNRVVIESLGTNQPVVYDINSMANLADHPGLHICIYTPVIT
ncbi:helix-turn-helix transcriptional regulator [Paenibacillus sp. FSL K6-1217]|uniref:helix-turn-helix transcriptional regulator n=1 Tax=Paenibacillus sp. FSL K6-1217 TaxID=2921466 RepID=UPI0032537EB4